MSRKHENETSPEEAPVPVPREQVRSEVLQALADARSGQEVTLHGRKYLLVPIDDAPARQLLTSREREIAKLVARGRLNKQIAADLAISEWTVATHLRRIYAKLDVDTRAEMVTKCFGGLRSSEE